MTGNELSLVAISVVVVTSATITLYFILNALYALKISIQVVPKDEAISVSYNKEVAQSELDSEQLPEIIRQILLSESESQKRYLMRLSENLNAYLEKLYRSILRKISALFIFYIAHVIILLLIMHYVSSDTDYSFRLLYTRLILFLMISLHGGLSVYFFLAGFHKPLRN